MSKVTREIQFTAVESPSAFYFRYLSDTSSRAQDYERDLRIFLEGREAGKTFSPSVGSIVAYNHLRWGKWIRVKIVEKTEKDFKLFFIDHGHFRSNNDQRLFAEIPEKLQRDSHRIKKGTLGLQPGKKSHDETTQELVICATRCWNEAAIAFLQNLCNNRENLKIFFEYSGEDFNKMQIGDIIIKRENSQQFESVSEELVAKGWAMNPGNFPSSNFERIAAVVHPKLEEKTEVKKNVMVPAGIDMQQFMKDERKKVNVGEARKPEHKTLKPSQTQVSDMFVFGRNLQSPVQSVAEASFSVKIKKNLIEMNSTVNKVQAHAWANLGNFRSMVIVAKSESKNDVTFAFLPAIINALTTVEANYDEVGPRAIIVTKSSSDVKEIRKLSSQLNSYMKIVEVYGSNNKTAEVMNGCDLLVSTPKALHRILKGMSLYFVSIDRLKHLVLDGVDAMLPTCEPELKAILSSCTKNRLNDLQLVITSASWIKDIETKLVSRVVLNEVVICIKDFIEAAASAGCEFTMEVCGSAEEKTAKLRKFLESRAYKSTRTILVINNVKTIADELFVANVEASIAGDSNYETAKHLWMQQTAGKFSLLIANDVVLQKMKLRNVQHLIHFTFPKSGNKWEIFARRFEVLLDQLHNHRRAKSVESLPVSKIFLDDENIDEFAKLIDFLKTRKITNLSESAVGYAKQILHQQELKKCEGDVAICGRIFLFGECNKTPCHSRHILKESDKLQNLPLKSIINFEIVSITGPTSFVIKIFSHATGGKLVSWSEKHRETEKFIKKDLQALEGKKPEAVKVGGVYGVKSNGKWQRCRVVEKPSLTIVRVFLIDVGTSIISTTAKIFDLPDEFKKFDPICCSLQVLNLVPLDAEDFWNEDTKSECLKMMEGMIEGCTFTCKTELAVNETLFTESFDAKDKLLGTIKFRFKNTMLKRELCAEDRGVFSKLRKLLGVNHEEVQEVNEVEEIVNQPPEVIQERDEVVQERWKQLSWNSYYEVSVTQYTSPESFLAVPDITGSRFLAKALKEIEDFEPENPLQHFQVGSFCFFNGRRGKILEIAGEKCDVLLVDAGEIVQCRQSDLLELPLEMISKIPFQTVSCRMLGIRPKFNMNVWPPKQRQAVHDLIMSRRQPLKVFVVKSSENRHKLGMNSYDAFLIDSENGNFLDDVAVDSRICDRDEKVAKPNNEDSGNVSEETEGDVEILRQLLSNEFTGNEEGEEFSEPESSECQEIESISLPKSSTSTASSLDFIHKHPRIEWRQNEAMIYLLVAAIDCESYTLRVDDASLEVTIKYKENRIEKCTINFYNLVESRLCSHKICGLKIIVRVPKKVFNHQWPRLTESRERSEYIKFSSEKIFTEVEEKRLESLMPVEKKSYAHLYPDGYEEENEDYSEESFGPSDAEDCT